MKLRATSYKRRANSGSSLLEVLLAIGIFTILSVSIFFTYGNILEIVGRSEHIMMATNLLNREMEIIRNLAFEDIGVQGGYPPGVIPQQVTKNFQGMDFQIHAFVRNIDDSFDGTVSSTPQDTAPADYRLVELRAECENCINYKATSITSFVAAPALEASSQNGSLFITVFDANGQPVFNTDVTVENNTSSPIIEIVDTTNVSGTLQLVDIPTSTNAYEIYISKTGYSSAQTYTLGGVGNPNPVQVHATVASQELTTISFAIDKVSSVDLKTRDPFCVGLGNIDIQNDGVKLIGSSPDVLKYSETIQSDENGDLILGSLEWDTYSFSVSSTVYQLIGSNPLFPLILNPDEDINLDIVLVNQTSSSLLVVVLGATGAPLSSANVSLGLSGTTSTKAVGTWQFGDDDWSGGSGTDYNSQDGNIDDTVAGTLTLVQTGGSYPTSSDSWLLSNTFDLGTSTVTLGNLEFLPTSSQPSNTTIKMQIASNNNNTTWNFVGPGNSSTTYFSPGSAIAIDSVHDGKQYLRYKVFLNTTNASNTPNVDGIQINFQSGCVPDGQVLFPKLNQSSYAVEVTASGYVNVTTTTSIASGWQELIIQMYEE